MILADVSNASDLTLNFVLGILASVVAGLILLALGSFLSAKFRWVLTAVLNALVRGDLESIFPNARAAQESLLADFRASKRVWIFAGRGNEFSRDTFDPLFTRPANRPVELRVLLPATDVPADQYNWTAHRAAELNNCDPGGGDAHNTQIDANVAAIAARRPHGDVQVRRFNVPNIGRIILTDRFVYFTPYQPDQYGRECAVYQFRRGGAFYGNLKRFIRQVWDASEPVP